MNPALNNFEALVLLNMVEGLGSIRLKKLIDAFQPPGQIFKLDFNALTAIGLTPLMARHVLEAPRRFEVAKEIDEARKKDITIVTIFDEEYPKNLKEIYDPPIVLYMKGEIITADINAVSVVGSRGASYYGLTCARDFSLKLSQWGLTIVSGMARGIDTASHRAALDKSGRTIAVLGSGLNQIYPPENEGLFFEIVQKGAVISQFPLNTRPLAANFPIRNRIISGLSKGVLVVEASQRSGALITARYALEQGREVFAIPGKLSSQTSAGANDLIKQGAKMVTSPEEILEDLRHNLCLPKKGKSDATALQTEEKIFHELNTEETSIVQALNDEPKYIDHICQETGIRISNIMSILMQLELKGLIKQLPGKTYVRRMERL